MSGRWQRTFARRAAPEVDASHELFALGVANAAAGLFQAFPISSSGTRTPVAESSGARTQLAGLTAAVVVALLLVVAPGLVRNLPLAALAAVVIAAAVGLLDQERPDHQLQHRGPRPVLGLLDVRRADLPGAAG
jgi:MFS superfamily sulfate permease-like transporter